MLICGDFNLPRFDWSNSFSNYRNDANINSACAHFINDYCLTQVVNLPTRITETCSNILDIVMTNVSHRVHNISTDTGISDHCAVNFNYNADLPKKLKVKKQIHLYGRADVKALKESLCNSFNAFCDLAESSANDINSVWIAFKEIVKDAQAKCIPSISITDSGDPLWINQNIKRQKRICRRLHHKRNLNASLLSSYKAECKKLKEMKRSCLNEFMLQTLSDYSKHNPKKFYQSVKSKCKTNREIPILKVNGKEVIDDKEKANCLNDAFASVYQKWDNSVSSLPWTFPPLEHDEQSEIYFSVTTIVKLLKNLQSSKSPGHDGISAKLLKLAPYEFANYLLIIYRLSFAAGKLPNDWKIARIKPIFKKGHTYDPMNYRPISITCLCCKIFETIVNNELHFFFESNKLFHESQHGFRRQRSCETQLVQLVNELSIALDNGLQTDLIFLDFARAFDKVPSILLLEKLRKYKVNPKVVNWISDYITDRTHYVEIGNEKSEATAILSGIIQGGVLSATLFIIFINDLLYSINCKCRFFADDGLLTRTINNTEDVKVLQSALETVVLWCNDNGMNLNIAKCEYMHVSPNRNTIQSQYFIQNTQLKCTENSKYLGILISSKLHWNANIEYISKKARKTIYFFQRQLKNTSKEVREKVYLTIIRPLLEYCSSVWDVQYIKHINILEGVQNKAARFVMQKFNWKTSSSSELKNKLNWTSLQIRRKIARLSLLHKAVNGCPALSEIKEQLAKPSHINKRFEHNLKIQQPFAKKDIRAKSFLCQTISDWNSLPYNVFLDKKSQETKNTPAFKNSIQKLFMNSKITDM